MPTLDDLLAELAAAPPAEFTQARDALVARLKTLGQAEAACGMGLLGERRLSLGSEGMGTGAKGASSGARGR